MGKDANNRRSQNLGIAKISMGQTSLILIARIFKAHDVGTLPQYTGLLASLILIIHSEYLRPSPLMRGPVRRPPATIPHAAIPTKKCFLHLFFVNSHMISNFFHNYSFLLIHALSLVSSYW